MLPMAVIQSYPGGVTQYQKERAILGIFFLIGNAMYGPYSSMNFATKYRFDFSLLITIKPDRLQFPIKCITVTNYLEITRKLN